MQELAKIYILCYPIEIKGNNNLKKNTIAIVIIMLLLISAVSQIALGFNIRIEKQNQELKYSELDRLDEYISKITFFNEKYPYNKRVTNAETYETTPSHTLPTRVHNPMNSAWSMFGQNIRHTCQSPYSTENNPGTVKWKYKTDGLIEDNPVIANDGTIYFGGNYEGLPYYLIALSPNGSYKWRYKTNGLIWGSSPAIDENGTIYVGSWDWNLYALYPNGTMKWRFPSGATVATSPVIDDSGIIYYGIMGPGDNIGRIYALYANGTERWHYDTGFWIVSNPAIADDGTVYIGSGDSYLYALNPNGTLKWRYKTGGEIHGHPSIADDGTIYIGSNDEYLYAIYPNNGTLKWKIGTKWALYGNPSIANDGTIYFGTDKLYAVNPDGTLHWSFILGNDEWVASSSPAISTEGTIYIGTNIGTMAGGEIISINPDGTERWRKRIANGWVESSPSIGEDGTVYIGSSSGNSYLYAFNYFELEAEANGPYIGIINEPIQLTGSGYGGYPPYTYEWDFGDGNFSSEQNPIHEYTIADDYTITLTITDDNDTIAIDTTYANIRAENNPPTAPTIDGPTTGEAGTTYTYTFVSTDPEGDDISYLIEWGDGEETVTGFYLSGATATETHKWQEEDTYIIKAKAVDTFSAESDWGTLEVTMPRNKPVLDLSQSRFPILFELINRWFDSYL